MNNRKKKKKLKIEISWKIQLISNTNVIKCSFSLWPCSYTNDFMSVIAIRKVKVFFLGGRVENLRSTSIQKLYTFVSRLKWQCHIPFEITFLNIIFYKILLFTKDIYVQCQWVYNKKHETFKKKKKSYTR